MRAIILLASAFSLLSVGGARRAAAAGFEAEYARLLKAHVSTGSVAGISMTLVDYAAWGKDRGNALALAELRGAVPPEKGKEAEAFWINAYNFLAVNMVLAGYPVKSIKDRGGLLRQVWDLPAGKINGREYTLGFIEHKILRPLGDPRVHFAIVCASLSCPDLRAEPYAAAGLEAQLDGQVRAFLANRQKGASLEGDVLRVSAIFKWFKEDFARSGGAEKFILENLPGGPHKGKKPELEYLYYNWSLNDSARAAPARKGGIK